MASKSHGTTRALVVLLLALGLAEDLGVLLRPGVALRQYYRDEILQQPGYLADIGEWAWLPIGLGIFVELALAVLAVAILLRAWRRPEARALALFLAIGGVGLPDGMGIPGDVIEAVEIISMVVGTAALLHFSMVFPEPIPADAPGWPPPRLRRMLAPRRLAVLTAATVLLTAAFGSSDGANAIAALVLIAGATIGALNMRASYRRADGAERKRVLWVLSGFYSLAWLLVLAIPLGIWIYGAAAAVGTARADALSDIVFQSVLGAGLILLPVFLGIGLFYDGAVDPRLAIRKTTVYGAVSAVMLTLFVGVEAGASVQLMSMLSLPTNVAPWVAGGSVAIAFGPVRRWVEKRTSLIVDRMIPATALAEGAREDAVVVFADICGYTRISATDEATALTLASLFHTTARRVAEGHGGRLVKTLGDGVVLEFPESDAAVSAATEVRGRFQAAAVAMGLERPELRCGVNRGAVARGRDGDIFGAAVNLASRLEGAAEPGDVLVSGAVAAELEGSPRWRLEPAGERTLKNVPEPVATFRLLPG